MIKIEATREQLSAATLVAQNVELQSVRLKKSRFLNHLLSENRVPSKIRLNLKISKGRHIITADHTLEVVAGVNVRGFAEEESSEKTKTTPVCLEIDIEYALEFKIPSGEIPKELKEKGFSSFARFNGLYISWPYFRQHIHYLCLQADIRGVSLPVLMVSAKIGAKANK